MVVALSFAVVAMTTGGQKPEIAATVGGTAIPMSRVDGLLRHAQHEATREGKQFPAKGSAEYAALQRQALDLIIYHEELEQSAAKLGIVVTEQQIEAGGRRMEAGETGGVIDPADETFWRESFRGALLYRRIFQRVSRGIRVTEREILADYRAHAALYRLQKRSLAEARRSIRASLTATKRNAAMARWVSRMRQSFAGRIEYAKRISSTAG